MRQLNPHARSPEKMRNVYKKYQKMKLKDLNEDADIIDLPPDLPAAFPANLRVVKELSAEGIIQAYRVFGGEDLDGTDLDVSDTPTSIPVLEHADMPGLHIIPSLLPPKIQSMLLSRLLHRDFSNPAHLTNIHTHYHVSYPSSEASFFSLLPSSSTVVATPIDAAIHKPLTVSQLLNKKMRWSTLGGQYDWTAKRYPDTPPPAFPADIKSLLEDIFADTKAEAAIVNLYSPGDTLSVHRDVAETSSTGLISISLGCDAIFVIGTSLHEDSDEVNVLTLRLRSGSAVYMSGGSRFAWHGVPQIVPGTCPDHLRGWPGGAHCKDAAYQEWEGWMENKRVNLNVRQMWE